MDNVELINIKGGANASAINAVARIVNVIIRVGQMIGSAIKRKLRGETNAC